MTQYFDVLCLYTHVYIPFAFFLGLTPFLQVYLEWNVYTHVPLLVRICVHSIVHLCGSLAGVIASDAYERVFRLF